MNNSIVLICVCNYNIKFSYFLSRNKDLFSTHRGYNSANTCFFFIIAFPFLINLIISFLLYLPAATWCFKIIYKIILLLINKVFKWTIAKVSKHQVFSAKTVKGTSRDKILNKSVAFTAPSNVILSLKFSAFSIIFLEGWIVRFQKKMANKKGNSKNIAK